MKKTIDCYTCKKQFESSFFCPSRTPKYCSRQCSWVGLEKIKVKQKCITCLQYFELEFSKAKRKYCSRKCVPKLFFHLFKLKPKSFWKEASDEQKLEKLRQLFEKHVVKKDGCWGWNSFLDSTGAGKVGSREHAISHYRLSYILFKGPIINNLLVLHKCHNRACSNPEHLYLGTNKDNTRDMIVAGRQNFSKQNSKNVKLNPEKARKIKELLNINVSYREIAQEFGVSQGTIQNIKFKKTWKDG